jgi:hypothetical protein
MKSIDCAKDGLRPSAVTMIASTCMREVGRCWTVSGGGNEQTLELQEVPALLLKAWEMVLRYVAVLKHLVWVACVDMFSEFLILLFRWCETCGTKIFSWARLFKQAFCRFLYHTLLETTGTKISLFFFVSSLSVMCIIAVGTGDIPLLSLRLGAIEAQWFRLRPELEAQDGRDSPTLTTVGRHWGPVIPTSAGTGEILLLLLWLAAIEAQWFRLRPELEAWSPGPGRFPYPHCGWVPLRPSDSDFGQNWKPGTGEIPLLSLWLGAIEAQWFRLRPELEARDRGDSPTPTVVGRHWGPVIQTSARIESPGPVRFPYSFRLISRVILCAWITGNYPHTTRPLINQSNCTGEHVEIKWYLYWETIKSFISRRKRKDFIILKMKT